MTDFYRYWYLINFRGRKHCEAVWYKSQWKQHIHMISGIITSARKILMGACSGVIDFLSGGMPDCNKHTMEYHCPLLSESPTNIILFPLNFSHIPVTFHLFHIKVTVMTNPNRYKSPSNQLTIFVINFHLNFFAFFS